MHSDLFNMTLPKKTFWIILQSCHIPFTVAKIRIMSESIVWNPCSQIKEDRVRVSCKLREEVPEKKRTRSRRQPILKREHPPTDRPREFEPSK